MIVLGGLGALIASLRSRNKDLRMRLQRIGTPLSGIGAVEELTAEESIFRPVRRRTRMSWLWERVEARYPLLDGPKSFPRALAIGVFAGIATWIGMQVLGLSAGVATLSGLGAALGGSWIALGRLQSRMETKFIQQFPEIVDQIVRLSGAGVPPVEAIATVAEDTVPPVQPILREITDALLAGLDADTALTMVSERVRLAEFTLFASVIRLQRRAGGGVSEAFSNLANTLRQRRTIALKAKASTAQTRLTMLVLMLMPPLVLAVQSVTSPRSTDILFNTEDGQFLLRAGVGLVILGLLVARQISARGET